VRVVTKRAWAISQLPRPSAASRVTRRSLGVRASAPLSAVRRGRAPVASSSSRALAAVRSAPQRSASSNASRSGARASRRLPARRSAAQRGAELGERAKPLIARRRVPDRVGGLAQLFEADVTPATVPAVRSANESALRVERRCAREHPLELRRNLNGSGRGDPRDQRLDNPMDASTPSGPP
jgi:hypothetical protein